MDFPEELTNPDLLGALVQHCHDDEVIGLRIDACLDHGDPSSWSNFLGSSGLVERETLNHVARSGACQFSAVADQLFRSRPVTESFRPDVYLRLLALHCISQNQNAFQDFMLHAGPVTRRQRQRGGGGVDMDEYARSMSSTRCDGDHITLQALCDALKVKINVVKWTRDDGWYPTPSPAATTATNPNGTMSTTSTPANNARRRRGARKSENPPTLSPVAMVTVKTEFCADARSSADGSMTAGGAADAGSSGASLPSPPVEPPATREARRPRRSVFVADTLRPRAVACLDPRACDMQLQGRTLWLSLHGEAHFRSLRVRDPVTEEEVALAQRNRAGEPSPTSSSSLPSAAAAVAASTANNGARPRGSPSLPASSSSSRRRDGVHPRASGLTTAGDVAGGAVTSASANTSAKVNGRMGTRGENGGARRTAHGDNSGSGVDGVNGALIGGKGSVGGSSVAEREAVSAIEDGYKSSGRGLSTRGGPSTCHDDGGGDGSSSNGTDGSAEGGRRSGRGGTTSCEVNVQDVVSAADGDKLHLDTVEGAQPAQQQEREEGGGLGKRSRQDGNGKGKGKEGAGEQEEEEEEDEEEEKLDCSICMCAVTDDADAASLDKCIHAFHFACIIKWGETTNQCPMCKARFYVVTRLRDEHVKRFRGTRRIRPGDGNDAGHRAALAVSLAQAEEEEQEGARAMCLHCGDGGSAEQLMLCDGLGCENGAHTFCCGLEEVPSGDWFCPTCQAQRDANARRDAILQRAWAMDSGSGDDDNEETNDMQEHDEQHQQRRRMPIRSHRRRRPAAGQQAAVPGAEHGSSSRARRARGSVEIRRRESPMTTTARTTTAVMNEERVQAFERRLVNSSGESNGDEERNEVDDEDHGIGAGHDSAAAAAASAMSLEHSSRSFADDETHENEADDPDDGTEGFHAVERDYGESSSSSSSSDDAVIARRSRAAGARSVQLPATTSAGRSRSSASAASSDSSTSAWRMHNRGARGGGGSGGSSGGVSSSGTASGPAGPNFWPRVLESATARSAPQHVFADLGKVALNTLGDEDGEGGGSEDAAGGAGLVAKSWADAKRAEKLARGETTRSKKGKARAAPEIRSSAVMRRPAVGRQQSAAAQGTADFPTLGDGASRRDTSTGTGASTPAAETAPPRRVFKRARMVPTSSMGSNLPRRQPPPPPPPPPPPLSPPLGRRDFGDSGASTTRRGSFDHNRRRGSDDPMLSPRLPAASNVRMGLLEVHALVRRLRDVATTERDRRSKRFAPPTAAGGHCSGDRRSDSRPLETGTRGGVSHGDAGGGRGGHPSVSAEVEETMEELRRVAVHGDATTLDVLLSSQLPNVLRLWLGPTADGQAFLPPRLRASLLKVLMALPVQKAHLRDSGIGKLVVAMAADPEETEENRELIKQIVRRWSQLVFRTPRELPVSPFSPHNHTSARARAPIRSTVGSTGTTPVHDALSPRVSSSGATVASGSGVGRPRAEVVAAFRSHRARALGAGGHRSILHEDTPPQDVMSRRRRRRARESGNTTSSNGGERPVFSDAFRPGFDPTRGGNSSGGTPETAASATSRRSPVGADRAWGRSAQGRYGASIPRKPPRRLNVDGHDATAAARSVVSDAIPGTLAAGGRIHESIPRKGSNGGLPRVGGGGGGISGTSTRIPQPSHRSRNPTRSAPKPFPRSYTSTATATATATAANGRGRPSTSSSGSLGSTSLPTFPRSFHNQHQNDQHHQQERTSAATARHRPGETLTGTATESDWREERLREEN